MVIRKCTRLHQPCLSADSGLIWMTKYRTKPRGTTERVNGSYCQKIMEREGRESMVTERPHSNRGFQNYEAFRCGAIKHFGGSVGTLHLGKGGPTASPNEGAGKGGDSSMDNKYLVLDGLTPLAASPPSRPYRTCSWEILHFAFSRGAV